MKKIKELLKKDRVERALKTFLEGFFSYIALNIMTSDLSDTSVIKGLIIGAIGSAISLVINSLKNDKSLEDYFQKQIDVEKIEKEADSNGKN